ncbi:protein RTM1 [Achaetomium macrosporum]|uniref:Protein RTM1 n=1 Tax=Achaetomium macrosporum TaxID=79813 RepID=A0AAN7C4D8_9PEZI|nr:protein RTM1 [Achaetomium macrosporum]
MAVLEPYKHGYYLWKYLPSVPAAALFCVVFLIGTSLLIWRIWKTRTWMATPFAIGGFMEFVGFAARASAHNKTGKLMPFVMQNNMILLAPVLFAASIYMVLGRVIRATKGEAHSIIKPRRLTRLFVTGDSLSLAIQGTGGGLMVVAEYGKVAQAIVIVGLVFQIVIFGLFCTTAFLFHRRMGQDPVTEYVTGDIEWEPILYMLYAVSVLIMLRSLFRVVEFIMGADGYLLSTEWPLYVFDAVPMLLAMVAYWRWFPSTLQSSGSRLSGTSLSHLTTSRMDSK